MNKVDYRYYVEEYGGNMEEESFFKASRRASAYISGLTMEKSELPRWAEDSRVKDAICSVSEEFYRQSDGRGEVASETNHNISRSYVTSGRSNEQKLYNAACMYLATTGLLYRGIG